MESIVNILTQATVGAFTGYITNTYAINMLFKEYRIFNKIKIGGVIIKTKDDFIDKISKLVEKDIINHKTLGRELHKEEFSKNIEAMVKDFFKDALHKGLKGRKIQDLHKGKESLKETEIFIKKIIDSNIEEATKIIFNNLTLEDLISSGQLSYALNNLIEIVIKKTEENKSISKFIQAFLEEKGHLSLEELFYSSDEILTLEIKKISRETPIIIADILESIDQDKLLKKIQFQLNQKKIGDIILPSNRENTLEQLKDNLRGFISSSQGKTSLIGISTEIIKALNKTEKSAFDLLSSDFREGIEKYLEKTLPLLTSKVSLWIKENSQNIEKLIQEGIDETVEGVQGMKGMLLGMIKDTVLADAASKNKVVEKIVKFIEKEVDIKEVSSGIAEEVIIFLKEKRISEISVSLEKNGFLTPEIIATQLENGLLFLVDSVDNKTANVIFEKTIAEVYSLDLVKIVNSTGLKDSIITESSEIINEKVLQIFKKPIKELFDKNNIPNIKLDSLDIGNISKNLTFTNESDKTIKIDDKIIKNIQGKIEISLERIIGEYGEKDLTFFLEKFNNIPDIQKKINNSLLSTLHSNLPQVLEGKIENMVSSNLNKLTPEEVNDVVHDFMGRELGPITKFGAVLGGLAGALLGLSGAGTSITTLAISPISLLIYGAVGVLTNVVALEMIFRPYQEKKFLNNIGMSAFSQGYIMKNKNAFGKNMGNFVEESLLERKMIKSRFGDLKSELAIDIKRTLSKDEFVIIEKIFTNKQEEIGKELAGLTLNFLEKNQEEFSNKTADKLSDLQLQDLVGRDSNPFILFATEKITEKYKELIISKENLNTFISQDIKNIIEHTIAEKAEYYISKLKDPNFINEDVVKNLIVNEEKEKRFQRMIQVPISIWVNNETKENLARTIQEKTERKFLSAQGISQISTFIKSKIENPINPQNTLGEAFNGRIKNYIEENIPGILRKIELYILDIINKNKENITKKVQENIYENLSFLQKGGYSLMGGDELITEVIENIVIKKIPPYIEESKKEIEYILRNTLEENIYNIKLRDIQGTLKEKEVNTFLEDLLSSKETKNNLLEMVYFAADGVIENLIKVPLENYLKVADLNTVENIYKIFNEELKVLSKETQEEIYFWKKEISQKVSEHGIRLLDKSFNQMTPENFFSKNPHFYNLLEIESPTREVVQNLFESIWEEELYKEITGRILSRDILATDLSKSFGILKNNLEIDDFLYKIYLGIISEFERDRMSFILNDTKLDILEQIILPGLDSIEDHLPNILLSIDFGRITEEEISKMDGKAIHLLFNSFAGKYFTRLKLWGLIGAGFGVHGGISLLATLSYFLGKEEKNEKT